MKRTLHTPARVLRQATPGAFAALAILALIVAFTGMQAASHANPATASKTIPKTTGPASAKAAPGTRNEFADAAAGRATIPALDPNAALTASAPYQSGPLDHAYAYTLDGKAGAIEFTTYAGLDQYLAALPRSISYDSATQPKPGQADFIRRDLDQPDQAPYVKQLADKIRQKTPNPDDQARIAISLVQHIPYDAAGASTGRISGKYPYEVLYTDTGVCQEKSELLADLLRELGYGTAIFRFDSQNHEAVGIRCPEPYSYLGSGYCFIETTAPAIPTYSRGNYGPAIGTLDTVPQTIVVNAGASMTSIGRQFADAQTYDHLASAGPALSPNDYDIWMALQAKYGLNAG